MAKKSKKCNRCKETKLITEFKSNKTTKDGLVSICNDCTNKKRFDNKETIKHEHFYLYRFLNKNNEIMYVGKTTNMNNRMYTHLNNHFSLRTPEKYDLYNNLHTIEYCEMESDYHMNMYEIHYICKYKPLYNLEFKSDNNNLFDIPDIIWTPYIIKSYIDDVSLYYYCNFKLTIKDIRYKLANDIEFYNEFIKEYLDSTYLNRIFNPDFYEVNDDGEYTFTSIDEDENIEEEINI